MNIMENKEINEAIALANGWERTDEWTPGWIKKTVDWPGGMPGPIPDYLRSPSAMHEAFLALGESQQMEMSYHLYKYQCEERKKHGVVDFDDTIVMIRLILLTPLEEVAKAYLRAIGKWNRPAQNIPGASA